MKDSAEITKIKKLHGESVSLINFLANKKTEVINQFCEGDNNLKTSTDENAKIAYVRENGMQIIGRLQVAGSIQSFDSIAQTKFEQYYKAGSILLDKETKLLVFLRNCLSPGLRLNKPEENSDVYFTEMSNVAQVVSSLDYLQIAVYNAEEIVLNKLVDKQNTRHQVQTSAIK